VSGDQARTARVRFGPFEADLRTGELTKHGIRVRVAEQPFQVLVLLLESPGQLVTRERLREELWPADTFVEFDRGLNSAVRRLRGALGDSSKTPRYIETLPKRGYRFRAAVELVEASPEASHPLPQPEPQAAAENSPPKGPLPSGRPAGRLAVALVSLAVLAGAMIFRSERSPTVQAGPHRLQVRVIENAPKGSSQPALSPDGRTLAYVGAVEEQGGRNLYIQRIDGGAPVRVTTNPGQDLYPAWSPDGARIAFNRRRPAMVPGQYIVSLTNGVEAQVGLSARGRVDWTPDGSVLVGAGLGPSDVFGMLRLDTREESPLEGTTLESYDHEAAVSSDGKTAAFARCTNPTSCDIYVRELDGGEPRRLTFQYGRVEGLDWTPDSDEIIYAMESQLYAVGTSGGALPAPLTFDSDELSYGKLSAPTLARLGTNGPIRLAFAHRRVDVDIWITDVSEGAEQILEVRQRKLIDSAGLDWHGRFSPDGESIAFFSDRTGAPALWISDRDGGRQRQVTPTTLRVSDDSPPAWSPDSRTIAFRASIQEAPTKHIYTIPAAGGSPRAITMGKDEWNPQWSGDGLWVYHVSRDSGQPEIWKAPFEGRGPAVPVTGRLSTGAFTESPDGRYLYFCSGEQGEPYASLFRMPIAGGEPEVIRSPFSSAAIQFGVENDIYYLPDPGIEQGQRPVLLARFDPDTGREVEVSSVANPYGPRRFSLSPDRRFLLTDQNESVEMKLMLVEDFH